MRDVAVEAALDRAGRSLRRVGSPYAVDPGTVQKADGTPFRVFTPSYKAWKQCRPPACVDAPAAVRWLELPGDGIPLDPRVEAALPQATEDAAQPRLAAFLDSGLHGYAEGPDAPAADASSRLSVYLKYGLLHPRQALAPLGRRGRRALPYRAGLAGVLRRRPLAEPSSARLSLQPAMRAMRTDDGAVADRRFDAWAAGRTGYPIVDAGMRQLLAEG